MARVVSDVGWGGGGEKQLPVFWFQGGGGRFSASFHLEDSFLALLKSSLTTEFSIHFSLRISKTIDSNGAHGLGLLFKIF
jgi:hypothetical protein